MCIYIAYICSLASRVFPKAKNYLVCAEFPMGSKLILSEWTIYFSRFSFINNCLKFKETEV